MSDFEKNALTASAAALTAACVYASTIQPPLVAAGDIYTGQMMGLMAQGSVFGPAGSSGQTALLVSKLGAVGKTAAVSKTLVATSLLKGGLLVLAGGSILFGIGVVVAVVVVVGQEIRNKNKKIK